MKLQDLTNYRTQLTGSSFVFRSDLFSKAIWGDMGEDCASITLIPHKDHWQLSFIRTQSGEPYPLAETVCNVIDSYEKELSDEQAYDLLSMHQLLQMFTLDIQAYLS